MDKFTYLGSTLSRVVHIDDKVNVRIATTWKYLGSKWNQISHKAESLQICGAANTIILRRNLDSLPTACQMTEPLPYKLSSKTSKDQVARQDSRHRSPEKGRMQSH